MIKTEIIKYGEKELIKTYSDEGRYVVRDGISYNVAIDPLEMGRTYTEGEAIIYPMGMIYGEFETLKEKADAYDILIGGLNNE